jgi:hypothetical protein
MKVWQDIKKKKKKTIEEIGIAPIEEKMTRVV